MDQSTHPNYPAQTAPAQVPPGWYPDPMGSGGERYWDGIAWSQQFVRMPVPVAPGYSPGTPYHQAPAFATQQLPAKTESSTWFVIVGWLCACFVPLIGLIVACTLISRNEKQGQWMLIVTLLSMLFLIAVVPYH